jgi:hypothetical protein
LLPLRPAGTDSAAEDVFGIALSEVIALALCGCHFPILSVGGAPGPNAAGVI